MKKSILLLVIAILLGSITKINAQSAKEGDIQIRAYYGYPYLVGAVVKSAIENDSASEGISVSNTNHIGGSVQFMLSEKVGLGLDYTFARVSASYMESGNRYTLSLTKHRITALMSFHFSNSEKLDPYFNVGAGYKMNKLKYTEPGFDDSEVLPNSVPLSTRIGIGLNYYFTEAFGMNAEIGIGGPIVQIGAVLKL